MAKRTASAKDVWWQQAGSGQGEADGESHRVESEQRRGECNPYGQNGRRSQLVDGILDQGKGFEFYMNTTGNPVGF